MNKLWLLIALTLILLASCKQKDPVFVLADSQEKVYSDHSSFVSYILIENFPRDTMLLKKLMIEHCLRMTPRVDSTHTYATCMFLKSTRATRKRFTPEKINMEYGDTYLSPGERNSFGWYNDNTYVGTIFMKRVCDNGEDGLEVTLYTSIGTIHSFDFRERGPNEVSDVLMNQCERLWFERNKEKELVRLFNELWERGPGSDTLPMP